MGNFNGTNEQLSNALLHIAKRSSTGSTDKAVCKEASTRIAELEAKLAKAVDALTDMKNDCKLRSVNGVVPIGFSCWEKLCATLTELKGTDQ